MTDQKTSIAPMAAYSEANFLAGVLQQRNLVLANQVHELSGTVMELRAQLEVANKEIERLAPSADCDANASEGDE